MSALRQKRFRVLIFLIGLLVASVSPRAFAEVTIASFEARGGAHQIKLTWVAAAERKNWGYNLERSTDQKNWQHVGANPSVKSQAPCIQNVLGATYELTDTDVAPGVRYFYRLQTLGQPCGDVNVYHEQIISAIMTAPTPTPISTHTPAPIPSPPTPSIAVPIPSSPRSFSPIATLNHAPNGTPTQVAPWQSHGTPLPSRQSAATPVPSVQAPPLLVAQNVPSEKTSQATTPAARAIFLDARTWMNAGMLGMVMVLCGASCALGVLALYAYTRRR